MFIHHANKEGKQRGSHKKEDVMDIPVFAVTAFAMKGDEKKILEAGCDDYIPKPISVPTSLEKVAKRLS